MSDIERDAAADRRLHAASIEWLARAHAETAALPAHHVTADDDGPLVSIIMPCWNRRATLVRAINSVRDQSYRRWELLVVDDGSTDDSQSLVQQFDGDVRIRLVHQDHAGVSAARNRALSAAEGEIVAYLDSDNRWYPHYLRDVVSAFETHPEQECVYFAQVFHDRRCGTAWIQAVDFDRDTFIREGRIDLNVFSHRRAVFEREGGFDTELRRLVDWELIGRYTRRQSPLLVPRAGGVYYVAEPDSISVRESFAYNAYLVQQKLLSPIDRPLRVLYVTGGYPQISETYIEAEIACMQDWGVEIEVWTEEEHPAAIFPAQIPVHVGTVEEALAAFRPDLIHVHWLHVAQKYLDVMASSGAPITVRGHGFEVTRDLLLELARHDAVSRIYAFPNQIAGLDSEKFVPLPVAIRGAWYPPASQQDRRLVFRSGAALATKDLPTFFDVAALCPEFRFVLAAASTHVSEPVYRQLDDYNRSLGNPVEILRDVPHDRIHGMTAAAGIYLHTYDPSQPYGMPIGIAEAMATGAFIIARRCAPAVDYIGDAGVFYDNAQQAAEFIRATADWSDEEWQARRSRSVERAFGHFTDVQVLRPVLDDWRMLAAAADRRTARAA